jgi:WXXGXW repeat (2 copies)
VQPRSPGPDYLWIGGYWYPQGNKYRWHDGYWTRPPYAGARWVEPHHDGNQYFQGRWNGDRGDVNHDHKWDRGPDKNRDYNRYQDRR